MSIRHTEFGTGRRANERCLISSLAFWTFGRGDGKPRLASGASSLAAATGGLRPSKGRIRAALQDQVNAGGARTGVAGICVYFVRPMRANGRTCRALAECLTLCQRVLAGPKNITRGKNIEAKLCLPLETLPPAGPA